LITPSDTGIMVHTISEEPDIFRMVGKSKVVLNYYIRFLRDLGLLVLEGEGRERPLLPDTSGSQDVPSIAP